MHLHTMRTHKNNKRKARQARGGCGMTSEEQAALTLLRSTGLPLLEAAQVACAAGRVGRGDVTRALRCVALGEHALAAEDQTVAFEKAAWESVEARAGRRATTLRDLRHFTRRMLRVEGVGARPLRAMRAEDCRQLLEAAFGGSVHSYRKGRAILHSIFAFGKRRGWCADNPVDMVDAPSVAEKEIVPLSPQQVQELEHACCLPQHADMRLSLHLLTYCGLRPAEVARLQVQDIRWEEGEVVVRPVVSKTGGGRVVPLRRQNRLRGVPRVIPRNWQNRWRALRRAAGFRHRWQPDVLRHTFATYHALCFKNLPELQLEMGHGSLALLRTRYVNATQARRRDADEFWK